MKINKKITAVVLAVAGVLGLISLSACSSDTVSNTISDTISGISDTVSNIGDSVSGAVSSITGGETDTDTSTTNSYTGNVYIDMDTEYQTAVANGTLIPAEYYKKVDGDTAWFTVDGEQLKVRFLGVDTPETVKEGVDVQEWGPEASEYTDNRLKNATEIYLEYDPGSDTEDAYGRTLAWVWVDQSLLEAELLDLGYAQVAYIYGDYLYTDILYEAQTYAQECQLGMWSNNS